MLSEMVNGVVDNKEESDFGAGVYETPEQPIFQKQEPTEEEKKAETTRKTMDDPDTRKMVYDATEYLIQKGIIKPGQ